MVSTFLLGGREGAKFILLVCSKRTECCDVGLTYSEMSQEKEDKEGQKEWPDLQEGSEAELAGELTWQRGSDAVKLHWCVHQTTLLQYFLFLLLFVCGVSFLI